jgi:hypothetical protein
MLVVVVVVHGGLHFQELEDKAVVHKVEAMFPL